MGKRDAELEWDHMPFKLSRLNQQISLGGLTSGIRVVQDEKRRHQWAETGDQSAGNYMPSSSKSKLEQGSWLNNQKAPSHRGGCEYIVLLWTYWSHLLERFGKGFLLKRKSGCFTPAPREHRHAGLAISPQCLASERQEWKGRLHVSENGFFLMRVC